MSSDTERIAHTVCDRYQLDGLHPCHTIGCTTYVAEQDYCPRCQEELDAEPYPLGDILRASKVFEWTCYAIAAVALALLVALLIL